VPLFAKGRWRGFVGFLRWVLHFIFLGLVLAGLWYLNYALGLERALRSPWPFLHKVWLPVLFFLLYILCWLGYALYRFAPLTVSFDPGDEFSRLEVQQRRARRFLDAYGCDREARRQAIDAVVPRLEALVALMRTSANAGDEAFASHVEAGHADLYLRDIDHVQQNAEAWRAVVGGATGQ
jgi:hypothetical protein